MLRPRRGNNQRITQERYIVNPNVVVNEYVDSFGNSCQRLVAPPGDFSLSTSADVIVEDHAEVNKDAPFTLIQDLPDTVLPFLLPSRYCESDKMGSLAREIVAGLSPGYTQVARISNWIHENVRYDPSAPNTPISATEVANRGSGVCRDFAHIALALLRSLSIPARMVVGYLHGLEPMDLHAWVEAYVGDHWYTFDPLKGDPSGGRVALGHGRDAADVAVFNQFGSPVFPISMEVAVDLLDAFAT